MPDKSQLDKDQAEWAAQFPEPDYITAEALISFLRSNGVATDDLFCADEFYSLPSRAWLTDNAKGGFAHGWASLLNGLGLKYHDESFDCDDFARMCAAYAGILQDNTRPGDSALAVGEFAFNQGNGAGGHAIVVAVWRDKESRKLQLGFFEPQPTVTVGGFATETMKPCALTPSEISSCYHCRF